MNTGISLIVFGILWGLHTIKYPYRNGKDNLDWSSAIVYNFKAITASIASILIGVVVCKKYWMMWCWCW